MESATEARFVVYGGDINHGFHASILEHLNRKTGLSISFKHIRFKYWADREPAFFLHGRDRILGNDVLIFSCPLDSEQREDLQDMVSACKKQFGARSVTVVMTFLPFRRQDRLEKEHEITRLRWFLENLKFWGTDNLILCEPHSITNTVKYCDDCGLRLFLIDPTQAFARSVIEMVLDFGKESCLAYSPDLGSVLRASRLAKALGIGMVATKKDRLSGDAIKTCAENDKDFEMCVREKLCDTSVKFSCHISDVSGKNVFIREDEIETGGTSVETAWMARKAGARTVHFLVTHPVCTPGWIDKLIPYDKPRPFDSIFFGNSRPRGDGRSPYRESTGGEVQTVDLSPAFAEALVEVINEIINSPEV
jgi:phosphoribosylpyrophosphate synthetase